jgi:hypothetical protein
MITHSIRWAPLVAVGLVCGLVQVAVGVVMYLSGVYCEAWSLRVMTALLAVCIVAGNWWYGKHVLAGHTTYWKALLVGIVGNLTAVSRLGTIYSSLISVGFLKRWRRAPTMTAS